MLWPRASWRPGDPPPPPKKKKKKKKKPPLLPPKYYPVLMQLMIFNRVPLPPPPNAPDSPPKSENLQESLIWPNYISITFLKLSMAQTSKTISFELIFLFTFISYYLYQKFFQ